ncbi:MAG: polysaccharide biosynthesis/export family protein [Candidatus Omnitrophica bacterium]|nr:polysaccharide biosynthesis/export family protein [Candidatus Omnitrophota bacterium]
MRRKRWMVLLLLSGGVSAAVAADAPQPNIADATRASMVEDYGRKVLTDSAGGQAVPSPAQSFYEAERRQMDGQLELITENEDTKYTIVPGDTLTIGYKDRDQIVRAAYKVSQAGEIYIALVGNVKLAGLARREARERLDMILRDYIRDPQVSVGVNTDGRIMIFGAVGVPGIYEVKNKMSVMESILGAGGFDRKSAEMASVIIIRGSVEKPTILKLNLKKMVQRGDRTDDIPVKPGDFVYIPTSFISNLETFWNDTQSVLMKWYTLGGSQPVKNNKLDWWKGDL